MNLENEHTWQGGQEKLFTLSSEKTKLPLYAEQYLPFHPTRFEGANF